LSPTAYVLVAVLVPLGIAVGFGIRLFLRQDSLIFRPGPVLDRSPAMIGIRHEVLELAASDGTPVTAWWVAGDANAPAVVYFHGSDGNLTHELPVVHFLYSLGVNALLIEYAGYGFGGGRPNEAGCYRSADAAWEHVTRQLDFAEDRVILFGHSLGAAIAARAAAGRRCAGLVLQSGLTSVRDLAARAYPYLPVGPFLRTRMEAVGPLRNSRCAVLVIHSRDDEHIPYEQGLRLFDVAAPPKKLVTLRGSHSDQGWRRSPEIRTAWRELLTQDFRSWAWSPDGA